MAPPQYPWFDQSKRREQLDDHIDRERMTNFGFRRVAAEDKVRWVARHFDRVAPKYDFMNTLLSFGIHHLWKRNAVRWMRLREADRLATATLVLDEPLRRLVTFLQPDRSDLWAVLVFALVIGGLLLATPIAVQALVNQVESELGKGSSFSFTLPTPDGGIDEVES